MPSKPNAFKLYTVIFLHHDDKFLLLKRAATKRMAPNRWTGVGGGVEGYEFDDLKASALRELQEETGLTQQDISELVLRRVLYHNRPQDPLTGLLYYTASYKGTAPECSEGTLHWKTSSDFKNLDIIETTEQVLAELPKDVQRDPQGLENEKIGVTLFQKDSQLISVTWA